MPKDFCLNGVLGLIVGTSVALFGSGIALGDDHTSDEEEKTLSKSTFGALKARSIGPALMSGRVGDFAVNPKRPAEYYIAVSSGNVWKTVNDGITFEPIFENEGSYSIGCVSIDPNNPDVVWVGTGENNSQRSVSFGDGVYKSLDGGKNWKNVGLPESEHIGMIAIHPDDPDTVFVASQGPLWRSGGDRGLYKTTDGGETWDRVLHVSDDTGINEVHISPDDPDTMYASAYQRRRHVWTLLNGGPESGVWKSTDGGETWREINKGLPGEDKGRIGLDISPVNNSVIFAIVEAAKGKSGFYRSMDRGETWDRMSDYISSSPQYYNEIVCDPQDVDTVYSLSTYLAVTRDGGKNFSRVPIEDKHVDDHAMWINPEDPMHMIVGCDGGIYDTYDGGANWRFKTNLPITQFYRVSVDQAEPFYNIYGGTQDNNSQGGPHRTNRREGITSEDWYITVGGDGYETVIDPEDHNIVYSQWQYGGLVRHDRRSGEITDIKPMPKEGEAPFVFNWDTPLIMSPHDNERLYFAGNFLFRSNDGGMSWDTISGDLTRGVDRNELEVMGVIQKPDAVAKHVSTSIYGNAVSLDESPVEEGLLYVGTDDGMIHVSDNDGRSWRTLRSEDVPGVPEMTYVSNLTAGWHDSDVVFASFDNKKMGDFKPYVYRSDDRGRTWTDISGDLPENEICYTLRQDHVNPDLLFIGTEFGCYFTINGGENWIKVSGIPTIAGRDIELQRRENDLVVGTFGRGFYVLDDYSPLREVSEDMIENADAHLFDIRPAKRYVEWTRLGGQDGRGSQGATYYNAPNPEFGAVFTYYLKDKVMTLEETRHKAEEGDDWDYPTMDEFRAEDDEAEPEIHLTVRDSDGDVVRRVKGSREKGMHRIAWDLRYPTEEPTSLSGGSVPDWALPPRGALATAGTYSVTLDLVKDGETTRLAGPESFEVVDLNLGTFAAESPADVLAFNMRAGDLMRAVEGAADMLGETETKMKHLRVAIVDTPEAGPELLERHEQIRRALIELRRDLTGDSTMSKRVVPQLPSIRSRISTVVEGGRDVTSPPTGTHMEQFEIAKNEFEDALAMLTRIVERDIKALEDRLEELGAPYTPGRLPTYDGR